MHDKLEALRKAIDSFSKVGNSYQIETATDAIASALKHFFALPAELKHWAVPLDQLLAYLSRAEGVPTRAARLASGLLEAASHEGYDGMLVASDLNEQTRDELVEELRWLYAGLVDEHGEDDDEDA